MTNIEPFPAPNEPVSSFFSTASSGSFTIEGFKDVLVPGVILLHLLGLAYQYWERRHCKVQGKTTYVAFVGFASRMGLCVAFATLPLDFVASRWDWVLFLPTMYEVLAHLYHWQDTPASFKIHLFGHHAAALLWWPIMRAFETQPFPAVALPLAVLFEAASGFSDAWYLFVTILGNDWLVPHLVRMCFLGQRLMRWASLLLGAPFIRQYGHIYPHLVLAFTLPSVLFEAYCIKCQIKTLKGGVCFT
jgi:hypothetical protein